MSHNNVIISKRKENLLTYIDLFSILKGSDCNLLNKRVTSILSYVLHWLLVTELSDATTNTINDSPDSS